MVSEMVSADTQNTCRRRYSDDAKRKLKFDLKLRVSREADYPLFIVSSEEKQSIGPELHQTMVDGIVGPGAVPKIL